MVTHNESAQTFLINFQILLCLLFFSPLARANIYSTPKVGAHLPVQHLPSTITEHDLWAEAEQESRSKGQFVWSAFQIWTLDYVHVVSTQTDLFSLCAREAQRHIVFPIFEHL